MKYQLSLMLLWFAAALLSPLTACQQEAASPGPSPQSAQTQAQGGDNIALRIKSLLANMTVEEKVGQMTLLPVEAISKAGGTNVKHELDPLKLKQAIVDYKVGAVFNKGSYAFTATHWHDMVAAMQELVKNDTKMKIPVLCGTMETHTAGHTIGCTSFPNANALAASWNPNLVEAAGKVKAYESRASGLAWYMGPVVDLGRQTKWANFGNSFGEDACLTGTMNAAFIRGMEGDKAGVTKHVAAGGQTFEGYSIPQAGFHPDWSKERRMRAFLLPQLQRAVDNGAHTFLIRAGEGSGTYTDANYERLTSLLKNELGFQGITVATWEDLEGLQKRLRLVPNSKEALKMAVLGGVDMCGASNDFNVPKLLAELVKEKEIPMSRIDDAVGRILRVKIELGLMEAAFYPRGRYDLYGSKQHSRTAMDLALESITVLKNEKGLLPLDKYSRVLITGPMANSITAMSGHAPNVALEQQLKATYPGFRTIKEAVFNKSSMEDEVMAFVQGTTFDKPVDINKAVAAVKNVNQIVICLGGISTKDATSSYPSNALPDAQVQLVEALAKTGKPITVILVEDRPFLVNKIEPLVNAIILAYIPGMEGGEAIASILFGDAEPCGRLPFTYPKTNEADPYDQGYLGDPQKIKVNTSQVLWPFGHGLSYQPFTYSNLKVSKPQYSLYDEIWIQVTVTNNGKKTAKEVVGLYVGGGEGNNLPKTKRLQSFQKVPVKPGEAYQVAFKIKPEELHFLSKDLQWDTPLGKYEVRIGDLTGAFTLVKQ